jgi:hypothetical protein
MAKTTLQKSCDDLVIGVVVIVAARNKVVNGNACSSRTKSTHAGTIAADPLSAPDHQIERTDKIQGRALDTTSVDKGIPVQSLIHNAAQ